MLPSLRHLAACTVAVAALALAAPVSAGGLKHYHIFPTPSYIAKTGYVADRNSGSMIYYGGSVFSSPKVVSVIWGSNVDPTITAAIPGFTKALVNSTYVDQMAEYGTHLNGHKGTKQDIGRGLYLGQIQITLKNDSSSITDDDIQTELKYQIKKGFLPKQDVNTLYMLYFPNNMSIDLDGLISCQDFATYHVATTTLSKATKKSVFYAVEPDCNSGLDFVEFAASREFAGATTDNSPTPGSMPGFPQAWNDKDGFEVGDKCGGSSGTLADTVNNKNYTVAQIYLNSRNGCSTGKYHSP